MKRFHSLHATGAALFAALVTNASAIEVRYWVWQRSDPLENDELTELAAQKVDTIYWQVGELEQSGQTWHWKARFDFPQSTQNGIHFMPAVRLVSHEQQPFSDASVADLLLRLKPAVRNGGELQLDYDAPDRLLSDYSGALRRIHQIAGKLTITALPHWSRPAHLAVLHANVNELLPMLYDYEAETVLKNGAPLPLIDPQKISKMLDDWHRCGQPWRAGLPVFSRLSLYDSTNKLRGQIRNWNWDEICLNPSFELVRPGAFATFIATAARATTIAKTPIKPGDQLVVREADRAALRSAIDAAERAGAKSVVLFRMPDSSASSGWSLHQLGHLDTQPELVAKFDPEAQSLELTNDGDADLEPGFGPTTMNGYAFEIASDAPIFREAHVGEFTSLTSSVDGRPVAVPFATHLQLRFSQLRAKEKLKTGLIQLAPGADFRQSRYRILNLKGGSPWKNFD